MRLTVVLFLALLVSGCSDSGDDGYCAALSSQNSALNELADAAAKDDPDYLGDALAIFERIREEAPDDLRDEWDTLVFAWSDLVDSLEAAGIDPGDFDPAKRPADLSGEEFRHVKDVAAELSSPRVRDAVHGINDHARNACDITLDL